MKVLYQRYLKSYEPEIANHLISYGLSFQAAYPPNSDDWENSPFRKPAKFQFSLLVTHVNGIMVSWNDKKYKIIETTEGKTIWLEIDTTYFKKPVLTFKDGIERKPGNIKDNPQYQNVKNVSETCPACGFRLTENDFECPDCGLNFR